MRVLDLPSLHAGVKRSMWRTEDPEAEVSQQEFEGRRRQVLEQDHYTCRFCLAKTRPSNSRPSGYFEVHHLDDDHTNNALSNLVTICPLCHAVFHAGHAGHRKAAMLIWLPELSQAALNRLCHTLLVILHGPAEEQVSGLKEMAALIYEALAGRAEGMRVLFGEDGASPDRFGRALAMLTDEEYARRGQYPHFQGIRLLPVQEYYAQPAAWWAANVPYWKGVFLKDNLLRLRAGVRRVLGTDL